MNDVSLRDYIISLLDEREKAHTAQWAASQKALDAASAALGARLERMNEFREQIREERVTYVRRDQFDPLVETIREIEDWRSNMKGRLWALGVGLAILTTVIDLAFRLYPK